MFSFTRCLEIAVHNFTIDSLSFVTRYRLSLISSSNFTSLSFLKLVIELCVMLSAHHLPCISKRLFTVQGKVPCNSPRSSCHQQLQKGGVPATPSGTATLLRLSPSHQFCPRTLLTVTYFRHPQLPWLDGRCVQGPGTYSPRHG